MKANIKLTVNGKVFKPGEIITEKVSKPDREFLLREKYISEDEVKTTSTTVRGKKRVVENSESVQ